MSTFRRPAPPQQAVVTVQHWDASEPPPCRSACDSIGWMKASLALAVAAALPALPAQNKPTTAAGLPKLRAAFEGAKEFQWAALIAVVQGSEPVFLSAGRDASGKDLTSQTLVPLWALAQIGRAHV